VEGDKKFNITTFAGTFGVMKLATVASSLLSISYLAAISMPFRYPLSFKKIPMIVGHTLMLAYGIWNYLSLRKSENMKKENNDGSSSAGATPADIKAVKKYYKNIWNMFYFEYLLYPFI